MEDFDSIGEVPEEVEAPEEEEVAADEPEAEGEPEDKPEPEPKAAAPVPEPKEEESEQGTEDDPLSIADLPEDQFVKIRVDGEDTVVSLRELANGHIRQQTFSRKVNEAKQVQQRAEAVMEKSSGQVRQIQEAFQTLVTTPEKMYEFMSERYPDELEKLATIAAQRIIQERESPVEERLRIARERERLKYERGAKRRLDAVDAEKAEVARQEQVAARAKTFAGPWSEAMTTLDSDSLTREEQVGLAKAAAKLIDGVGATDPEEIRDLILLAAKRKGIALATNAPAAKGKPIRVAAKGAAKRRASSKIDNMKIGPDGMWDFNHIPE